MNKKYIRIKNHLCPLKAEFKLSQSAFKFFDKWAETILQIIGLTVNLEIPYLINEKTDVTEQIVS